MADFLLELLSEEIPARMQAKARNDLSRLFAEALGAAGLNHGAIAAYSTPRRLALIVRDVAEATEALSEEVKGPRTSAPDQALDGFLRKTGLTRAQLQDRDGIWFAKIDRPGRGAGEVIAEAIAKIVADFPWPKSMRWGDSDMRWVRPLHSVIAILGETIVPVDIAGIASGATTLGHRFHHPGPITIGGAADYVEKLRACHVIVDQDEREAIIRDGAAKAAKKTKLALIEDEGLVMENAGLTEWPVPLLGEFDPDSLDVPREVIVLTMRTNQKYFACAGDDGGLAPAFVCVANIDAADGGKAIVEGNRRVLAARLADARFFWEQDLKIPLEEQAKKLGGIVFHEKLGTVADKVERVAKLARWLVEEGIISSSPARGGGPAAKRAVEGAHGRSGSTVGPHHHPSDGPPPRSGEALADQAERAAGLAKADLVTGMVGEFPELQGVIGGYIAEAQGEPKAIADAVRDHYKPVGQGDEVPTAPVTVAVSLADKLDTLISFFLVGEEPTGSRDPYALRRSTLSVLVTLLANDLRLPLFAVIGLSVTETRNQIIMRQAVSDVSDVVRSLGQLTGSEKTGAEMAAFIAAGSGAREKVDPKTSDDRIIAAAKDVVQFFIDRIKVQQRDAGIRHDLIDAAFAFGIEDDLVRLLARVNALQKFVETDEGTNLLIAYKRAANILKKEKWAGQVMSSREEQGIPQTGEEDPLALVEEPILREAIAEMASGEAGADLPEEQALIAALDAAEPKAAAAISKEDFTGAMAALALLRGPIDAFFDHVTVNDPDDAKREHRLNLLMRFRDAVNQVADFSKIEG